MRVSRVCNATLLAIIAKKEEITYEELKKTVNQYKLELFLVEM